MIKLSPCAETIFTDLSFLERIDKFAGIGFSAFEFWGWRNKDIDGMLKKMDKNKIVVSSVGVDPWAVLVQDGQKDAFLKSIEESVAAAHKMNVKRLIVTTGNELQGVPREAQHENIVKYLKAATPIAEKEGVTLVLEPLNILVNHKGYYLSTSAEGFQIIREVGSKNVKLLYDIYHQQITEGNIIQNITQNVDLIGHFHSADVPGRHEFGTGELNYRNIIQRIKETGYNGYIGLEFIPLKPSGEALKNILEIMNGVCD
ncbi:hydroxypyruvate isomerase [Candidatus Desantisbacteria bacterium CG1_02_38_46]|uniref:Hydroxypyruvate isomerase n=3 Tax=unclassified Candidatus Desantisiibacteriota TaxID=3106372 RepID=A0A2H9PC91_9BACT|nr:MAG: hydroxypyruvate isomerase [Candidatus Desantisbacteria bacterium CG1_02_38_46]PIU51610.1 MAG: hydroxypyruvate isomerase [Candidatus Desantisbacteria bacterium CG07_land_8_20_14_0_80_39_15]PIZ16734.1 MAG: hydroxypyruvate isomerase [Candidatus Desantisbacteria bacterium CG_4_10_14_0_8_um_filter_39_17]